MSLVHTPLIKVPETLFLKTLTWLTMGGNVSHIIPSFHGLYSIPINDNAANHTPGFTDAAATDEAHRLTLLTSKGMAGVALRFLTDEKFAKEVKDSFERDKSAETS